MKILSQRNPNWAASKLGAGPLTIGQAGCTTTCISMLSDYFDCFQTPAWIAKHLDWYTPPTDRKNGPCKIIWTKMQFARMRFVWREYGENGIKIDESLKDPNKAVILQVNNGAHWVVAMHKAWFGLGSDYVVADPWTGKKCYAKKTYHNITGSAHFQRA